MVLDGTFKRKVRSFVQNLFFNYYLVYLVNMRWVSIYFFITFCSYI